MITTAILAFLTFSAEQQVEFKGRVMTASKFASICKRPPAKQLANAKAAAKLEGLGVIVEGTVSEVLNGVWTISLGEVAAKEVTVSVVAEKLKNASRIKPGLVVQVAGVWKPERSMDGLLWELVPPGLKWEYELENPKAIVAGTIQTYTVVMRVTNTGKQPLRDIVASVRLWQISSPTDSTKEIEILSLAPGESKTIPVRFTELNFEYLGATSRPKCAATVIDYGI